MPPRAKIAALSLATVAVGCPSPPAREAAPTIAISATTVDAAPDVSVSDDAPAPVDADLDADAVDAAVACDIDLSSPEAIEAYDFQGRFGLTADQAESAKAWTIAAVEIAAVAARVDALLVAGCAALAHDLGTQGQWSDGAAACRAARDALTHATTSTGGYGMHIAPPSCAVPLAGYADCLARCDSSLSPNAPSVACEPGSLQGTCGGNCAGTCELAAPSRCSGECSGSCDASFVGSCAGQCRGTCDGASTGPAGAWCPGECKGRCGQGATGTCGGTCQGACVLAAPSACSGTCSGRCSVAFVAPACAGSVTAPKTSLACSARCDAWGAANARCTPAHVSMTATGTGAVARARLVAALSSDLPSVETVTRGLAPLLTDVLSEAAHVGIAPRHPCIAPALDAVPGAAANIRAGWLAANPFAPATVPLP